MTEWYETEVLIIGKAYPEPSKKHVETVCTGGITKAGNFVRMYPIPFRYWAEDKQYKLFSYVKAKIRKDPSDNRKESYRVDEDSLEILSHVKSWPERMAIISPMIAENRELLERKYHEDWTSIGIIPIEYIDFTMEWRDKKWMDRKKAALAQELLFEARKPLSQIPIRLVLKYRCSNGSECPGHYGQLILWEYIEAFRKWIDQYDLDTAFNKLKSSIYKNFSDKNTESLALVGTHSRHPSWMLGGLFFPPKHARSSLFNLFDKKIS